MADVIVYFPAVYWIFAARKTLPGDVHGATNMVSISDAVLHMSDIFSYFFKKIYKTACEILGLNKIAGLTRAFVACIHSLDVDEDQI